jgi:UDP-glucose 4-epimerase
MKILVTGSRGYVGRSLTLPLSSLHDVTAVTRNDFDLTDSESTNKWFCDKKFDIVIHSAISGGSRLKKDEQSIYEDNILMFKNIMGNRDKFDRLISFGSGAEIFSIETPYGKSKKWIADQIHRDDKCHNIRIFGVFDHNELSTRFIKSNIIRYINKEPMVIHSNKIMDFYYMEDLVSLVKFYLTNSSLPKTINCSYEQKYTLLEIAKFINTLDTHTVPILVEESKELEFYCGNPHGCGINEIGLFCGIKETYKRLNHD